MTTTRSKTATVPTSTAQRAPANIVVPQLAARLDAALGNDAWAVGHRAAALAFAAAIIDPVEMHAFALSPASARYAAAIEVLTRYLLNTSDTRGYSTV